MIDGDRITDDCATALLAKTPFVHYGLIGSG